MAFVFILVAGATPAWAGGNAPEWLRQAAHMQLPAYPPETKGVKLLDEQITTVTDSGEVRTLQRIAYRILRTSGRDLGEVSVGFDSETKLTSLHGWSITAQGVEYEVKEKDAIEVSPFSGEMYSDYRLKILKLPASEPGNVVGFEYEQKSRPFLLQDDWLFQSSVPVRLSRYILNLPQGWEFMTAWRNHPKVDPQVSGTQYRWEINDLAPVKTEELNRPSLRAIVGRAVIKFLAPGGHDLRTHRDWNDIGEWYANLANGRQTPTPELQQKVRELTASKATQWEKVRALAYFAQHDVRYVEIEIGIGGFQPHSAGDIFRNRYGDCKDKATVLAAMLREIGVESHYVLIYNKHGVTARDFPSHGFNHAILAIEVPKEVPKEVLLESFPLLDNKQLGRLLIFDPTAEFTPFGQLPPYEQTNYALLVLPHGGELVQMPALPPATNQLKRSGRLSLSAEGRLSGEVREVLTGANAAYSRHQLLALRGADRDKSIEQFISQFLSNFTLKDFKVEHLEDYDQDLVITYNFEAANYAKEVSGLWLLRPRVFGSNATKGPVDLKDRHYDLELGYPTLQSDEFAITLPPGFTVDELPPATTVTGAPISYSSQVNLDKNVLTYKREYKLEQFSVPLDQLKALNGVFRQILADERNSAVLKRQ